MVMRSLGEILKKQMPQKPIAKQLNAAMVVDKANQVLQELFGVESKRFAQAVYLKDNAISITCLSSVMAQELKLNEKKIILDINNKLGSQTVEKLRYLA